MPNENMDYFIQDDEREHAFIRRIRSFWAFLSDMLISLDIDPNLCWALLETDMSKLTTSLIGEVDILVGRMAWSDPQIYENELNSLVELKQSLPPFSPTQSNDPKEEIIFQAPLIDLVSFNKLAADSAAFKGSLEWTPLTDYLVSFEVKFARVRKGFDPLNQPFTEKGMGSTKSSPKKSDGIKQQIDKMIQLGCDKVVLLDLIANPPADGINGAAWINALVIAKRTMAAMERILGERLEPNSIAGHWGFSIGAVAGEDERMRTSIPAPQQFRDAQPNIITSNPDVQSRRLEVEKNLTKLFSSLPKPHFLPALFINCRSCKTIHWCGENDPCSF